jgi:hypothetical protein
MTSYDLDVFGDESPTEMHHKDCPDTPDSYPTGDANAVAVQHPEQYAQEGETFDRSCSCLDPLLGSDRRDELNDDLPILSVGDHVSDRDDPGTTMLVVGTPLARAKTYEIDDDTTVADANPDYPAADHVVECVFPQLTTADLSNLRTYAYPRERLERVAAINSEEGDDA